MRIRCLVSRCLPAVLVFALLALSAATHATPASRETTPVSAAQTARAEPRDALTARWLRGLPIAPADRDAAQWPLHPVLARAIAKPVAPHAITATATFVVDTAADTSPGVAANCAPASGVPCSLRDAIAAVNALTAGTTGAILFDPTVFATPQTITLGLGLLTLRHDATITGPGSAQLSISGGRTTNTNGTSILQFGDTTIGAAPTVTLSGVTITKGNNYRVYRDGPNLPSGAGILALGPLTLIDCVVSDNRATGKDNVGGAAIATIAPLILRRTRVVGNVGLLDDPAPFFGTPAFGVVLAEGGLVMEDSEVADNSVTGLFQSTVQGGGLFVRGDSTIRNSTVARNTLSTGADSKGFYQGAGMYFQGGILDIDNSSFAGNLISDANAGDNGLDGGGLFVFPVAMQPTTATLRHTTVTANRIAGGASSRTALGAGVMVEVGADLVLANSIIGANTFGPGTDGSNVDLWFNGVFPTDLGGNLYDPMGSFVSGVTGLDFGGLGSYGGATETLLPLPGSRAICAGRAGNVGTLTTDQRGAARVEPGYDGFSAAAPCVDAGAVQTHYTLAFVAPPGPVVDGALFAPPVTVAVRENGLPLSTVSYPALTATDLSSLTMTVSAAAGTLAGSTSAAIDPLTGFAGFAGLGIGGGARTNDTLKASLRLDSVPAVVTASIASDPFNVLQPASLTLSAAPNPAPFGASVVLTATVAATPVAPTGNVAFTDAGTPVTGCAAVAISIVAGASVATCTLSVANANLPAAGTHPLVATYQGDAQSARATSTTLSLVVTRADQSIVFGAPPSLRVGGAGSVTATGGASGQPVVFGTSSAASICTVTAAGVVTGLGAGTCIVTANQAGDANYNAAAQASQNVTIAKLDQAITFGTAPAIAVGGAGSVTATGGASTQPVVFGTSSAASICTVTTAGVVSGIGAGTCIVTANQAGDANYNAAPQATQAVAIGKAAQTITFGAAPSVLVGGTGSVTATGGASTQPVLFGTSSAASICTVTTAGVVSGVGAGTCIVTANQAGDANYNAAPQATQTVAIGKAAQTITFGAAPSVLVGGTGSVTATGGGSMQPVLFGTSSAASICTVTTAGVVSGIGAGTCVVTANQAGDANHEAAAQATQAVAIGKAAQTITFAATPDFVVEEVNFLNATGGGSGQPIVFGTSSAASICTVSTDGVLSAFAVGICVVTADQAGDANYNAAPRATLNVTIGPGIATVLLDSSLNPSVQGQLVTFSVIVVDGRLVLGARGTPAAFGVPASSMTPASTSPSSVTPASTSRASGAPALITPTGSVRFEDGSTLLATVALDATGQATFSTSSLGIGAHTIIARYDGDANHVAASAQLVQQVLSVGQVLPAPMLDPAALLVLLGVLGSLGALRTRRR